MNRKGLGWLREDFIYGLDECQQPLETKIGQGPLERSHSVIIP